MFRQLTKTTPKVYRDKL
nr:hypothetical protein [Fischerella thermalis]